MTAAYSAGASYHAARERAAFLDRSDRVRLEFTGPQAAATLNGLVTSDVLALRPGAGQYAAALTAKGKVIADVRIFAGDGTFLVDADAAAAPGLAAMLKKFVNPRFAKVRDVSAETCDIGVFGPAAAGTVAGMCGIDADAIGALAGFAHVSGGRDGEPLVQVLCTPELGVPGFEVVAAADRYAALMAALREGGAAELDAGSAGVLRVEAGWPRYGDDFDENQLAQEAGLDRLHAISFTKGCYTGQETVIRVHHRGHVNRALRGLRAASPVDRGAPLHGGEGNVVGEVRSSAVSPSFGPIALAYVRREIADGAVVAVGAPEGGPGETPAGEARPPRASVPATVVPLPFG